MLKCGEDTTPPGLRYVGDDEPGMARRRCGKGFRYFSSTGKALTDRQVISRIKALAIPPAWTDVWICEDTRGHIQATGRDQRSRKQYRYHAQWTASRDEEKFGNLAAFARALPDLRKRVEADLNARPDLNAHQVVASVVWLLDHTMIRVGNAAYARDNNSFGLTTLRTRHVAISGSRLRFVFKGKSGKEWRSELVDRRMARVLRSIQELPGQQLFQYIDDDDIRRPVTSGEVNDYIRETIGDTFSAKDFRTWGGTVRAYALFSETPLPETRRDMTLTLNRIVDRVAGKLGNTRTICRKCYIHPAIVEDWQAGKLARNRTRRPPSAAGAGLDSHERRVFTWLTGIGRGT